MPECADQLAKELLDQIACGIPIRTAVALIAAHPDDEIIGAGGTLARLLNLTLIHITDGAPEDLAEITRLGFADRESYAATRKRELDAALAVACAAPVRRLGFEIPDGQAANRLNEITERLFAEFMSVDVVLTHPYEGGHVDHDACARACHDACSRLRELTGDAPSCIEFASYYQVGGYVRTGSFWPAPESLELTMKLEGSAARRRESALRCFSSQSGNLRYFSVLEESFRTKPNYDFSAPPPPVRARS